MTKQAAGVLRVFISTVYRALQKMYKKCCYIYKKLSKRILLESVKYVDQTLNHNTARHRAGNFVRSVSLLPVSVHEQHGEKAER